MSPNPWPWQKTVDEYRKRAWSMLWSDSDAATAAAASASTGAAGDVNSVESKGPDKQHLPEKVQIPAFAALHLSQKPSSITTTAISPQLTAATSSASGPSTPASLALNGSSPNSAHSRAAPTSDVPPIPQRPQGHGQSRAAPASAAALNSSAATRVSTGASNPVTKS